METTQELRAVRVSYEVRRTVYVYADSDAEAKRLARNTVNWADEATPEEQLDRIKVTR